MRFGRLRFAVVLVLVALTLAACNIDNPVGTEAPDTTGAPDPTDAPATTQAPDPTDAPGQTDAPSGTESADTEEGNSSILWFVALAILGFVLIGTLIGRGRKDNPPPPVAAGAKEGFRDFVRGGYSEARWLADAMTEDLAIWRGNALFEGRTGIDDSAGTAMSDNWAQLDDRMGQATDQLYRAEASAPDQTSSATVRATIDALNGARGGVDARAEARFNTRGADESDQFAIAEAGERERLASSNLSEAHQKLSDALLALNAIS